MFAMVEVLRSVLILRRIAASNLAAQHAHSQMYPGIADFYALLTGVLVGCREFDFIQVLTFLCHFLSPIK
jgi:hypothetical protein